MIKQTIKALGLCTLLFSLSNAKDIDGFSHPESVFIHKGFVFVSNVGQELAPLAKDNDGFITKIDSAGNVIEKDFIKNLHAHKRMNAIGNILYVADIDTIRGFDIDSKKEVFNLDI